MASEGPGLIVNGGQASKSPAALLSEQHEKHTVTVEDTVDEDDIQHPPPSSLVKPSAESSEAAAPPVSKPTKAPALDVQSEELFPALGSGPKSKAAANVPTAWGAKRPAAGAPQNGASSITQPSSMFQISVVNFYFKLTIECYQLPPIFRMRQESSPSQESTWSNCVSLHRRCFHGISSRNPSETSCETFQNGQRPLSICEQDPMDRLFLKEKAPSTPFVKL